MDIIEESQTDMNVLELASKLNGIRVKRIHGAINHETEVLIVTLGERTAKDCVEDGKTLYRLFRRLPLKTQDAFKNCTDEVLVEESE